MDGTKNGFSDSTHQVGVIIALGIALVIGAGMVILATEVLAGGTINNSQYDLCVRATPPAAQALLDRYFEAVQVVPVVTQWPFGLSCTFVPPVGSGDATVTVGPGWIPTLARYVSIAIAVTVPAYVGFALAMAARSTYRPIVIDAGAARARRVAAGASGVSVLIGGLFVDRLVVTSVPLVDVLYAAFAYLLVVLIRPRMSLTRVAASALGFCVAIELLQLTPIPKVLVTAFPPTRFVLGGTFADEDLLAYAVGVVAVLVTDRVFQRKRARSAASARSQ